jgi:hypothetical protein
MRIYVRLEENHQMPGYESSAGLFEHPVSAFIPSQVGLNNVLPFVAREEYDPTNAEKRVCDVRK